MTTPIDTTRLRAALGAVDVMRLLAQLSINASRFDAATLAYLEAMDTTTVRALLDEVERLRAGLARCEKVVIAERLSCPVCAFGVLVLEGSGDESEYDCDNCGAALQLYLEEDGAGCLEVREPDEPKEGGTR